MHQISLRAFELWTRWAPGHPSARVVFWPPGVDQGRRLIPPLQLLANLGVGEQCEQPRSANHITDQRRSDKVAQSTRDLNFSSEQQQKGLSATGDDVGEITESDDVGQGQ